MGKDVTTYTNTGAGGEHDVLLPGAGVQRRAYLAVLERDERDDRLLTAWGTLSQSAAGLRAPGAGREEFFELERPRRNARPERLSVPGVPQRAPRPIGRRRPSSVAGYPRPFCRLPAPRERLKAPGVTLGVSDCGAAC